MPADPTTIKAATEGARVDRKPTAHGASTVEKLRGEEGGAATREGRGRTIPRIAASHVDGPVAGGAAAGGETEAAKEAGGAAPHVSPTRSTMPPLPLDLVFPRRMVRQPLRPPRP